MDRDSPRAAAELAGKVLADVVATGRVRREDLEALARAVLKAHEPSRLAVEVLEGGEHATRRALELAALVLAAGAEECEPSPGTG